MITDPAKAEAQIRADLSSIRATRDQLLQQRHAIDQQIAQCEHQIGIWEPLLSDDPKPPKKPKGK